MTFRQSQSTLLAALTAAAAAIACGKAPPPIVMPAPPPLTIAAPPETKVKSPMTIRVSNDANPDRNGRPSQVVLRVYQLKTDAAFTAAELLPLYDDEQKVLGPELISRDEFVLQPADTRTIDVTLSGEARFIGVIVPFRDDRNAQWRAVVPAPSGGLTVEVRRASVVLNPAP